MQRFEGRTAVVTGGGSGIGRGLALTWAAERMKVVVADIRLEAAQAVAAEITEMGGEAEPIACDVADPESVLALADRAFERFDTVDLLCNNAGISMRSPLVDATVQEWNWVLAVNLFGIVHAIHAFVPRMRAQPDGGHIVNTSSGVSIVDTDYGNVGLYRASKAAVTALTERLRYELHDEGIGVSLLLPSRVESAIHETSVATRPAELGPVRTTGTVVRTKNTTRLQAIDPMLVGKIVRNAVRRDRAYIHTDHALRAEVMERFGDLIEAFADLDLPADGA